LILVPQHQQQRCIYHHQHHLQLIVRVQQAAQPIHPVHHHLN
jgi:hypothetical protein